MPTPFSAIVDSVAAQRDRWVLWLPVGIAVGVGLYFSLPAEPPAWLLAIAGSAVAAAAAGAIRWPSWRPTALLPIAVVAGFAAAQWRSIDVAAPVLDGRYGPALVQGRVLQVERLPRGPRVVLDRLTLKRTAAAQTPEKVRIRLHRRSNIHVGDRISVIARLRPPPPPVMPGAYDFQRMAWFRGIGAVGFALGPARVGSKTVADRQSEEFSLAVSRTRQRIAERVRAARPGQAGQVATALLVGDRSGIAREVIEAMRDSGLAHLLAISGLHVGLVAAILFFAARLLLALTEPVALRWPIKKWAALIAIVGAFGYLLLAGATVPTQRAFVMTGIALLAVILDRKAISLRLVAAAAAAVLLLSPESLTGASFQMSFAAVVALVAAYEGLGGRMRHWLDRGAPGRRVMVYLLGVALSTLIAGAATGLIALHHFGRFAQFGLVANLIAVPLTALWIMPWGVLSVALMPLGLEAIALGPMAFGIDLVLSVAHTVASWPGSVALLPAMPTGGLLLVAAGGLWLCLWKGGARWLGIAGLAAGVLTIPLTPRPDILVSGDGRLIAARMDDGRLSLSSNRVQKFAAKVWMERDGARTIRVWRGEAGANRQLSCDLTGCLYRRGGRLVALVLDGRALTEDCAVAEVVVSTVPVRWRCRGPTVVIDRFGLWRGGAYAIWLGADPVRVASVASRRGRRPWVWRPAQLRKAGRGPGGRPGERRGGRRSIFP